MKYFLTDELGASSVLIIFLMLVLAILGTYSISSARVNYTFSNKTLVWNREYFDCDAQAEEFLMDIDSVLAGAEQKAIKTDLQQGTGEIHYEIEMEMQNAYDRLYMQNMLMGLQSLFGKYPDLNVSEDGSSIGITMSAGARARIDVKIAVLPLRYSIELIHGEIKGTLTESRKRYMVLEWKHRQIITSDNIQKPLWDGQVE